MTDKRYLPEGGLFGTGVPPFFCKAVDIILSNGRIKRTFFEKQPHISKFVGVLYDTGSFSPNIIQIHKMRQYFWMKRLK